MPTLPIQPDETTSPDLNIGVNASSQSVDSTFNNELLNIGSRTLFGQTTWQRALLRFSLAALPSAAVVTSAILTITVDGGSWSSPTIVCRRVTRTNWDETGNWFNYKSGSTWTTAGGDVTSTHEVSQVYTSGNLVLDVTDIVNDCLGLGLSQVDLRIRGHEQNNTVNYITGLSSATADASERPKLVLTWQYADTLPHLDWTSTDEPIHYRSADEPLHWRATDEPLHWTAKA